MIWQSWVSRPEGGDRKNKGCSTTAVLEEDEGDATLRVACHCQTPLLLWYALLRCGDDAGGSGGTGGADGGGLTSRPSSREERSQAAEKPKISTSHDA